MGETSYLDNTEPFAELIRSAESIGIPDGAVGRTGRIWGTYLHRLFDDDAFRHRFLSFVRRRCGLNSPKAFAHMRAERDCRIDRWADHLRGSLDLNLIRGWLNPS
jgi:adenosylcobyric acid synthase